MYMPMGLVESMALGVVSSVISFVESFHLDIILCVIDRTITHSDHTRITHK